MTARDIELDRIVDYKTEYLAVIEKAKITGDNLIGLCPFHDDRNNSFSVDLKTGKWHCFSEDIGGNFTSFWARLHGVDTKEAYRQILEKYHITLEEPGKKKKPKEQAPAMEPYSVQQYAFEKRLPEDFLEKTCRLTTGKDRDGTT